MTTPRIYTYKVTFEEIPDWYWGAHKEAKYNDGYLGSPSTHAWKWEFYTPHLQICELFPHTEEGWMKAREIEDRCILPDLNNPLCLNEHVGGSMSLESNKKGGEEAMKQLHKEKDDSGRSAFAVKGAATAHKEKDDLGRSVHAVNAFGKVHNEKDDLGKSVNAVKGGIAVHIEKDDLGRSTHGVKSAERLHEEKDYLGRSIQGVKNAERVNAQKWEDPDHPELGQTTSGPLTRMQKSRGYPHGKENRVLVKQGNSQ
jgi:hypothetical protein